MPPTDGTIKDIYLATLGEGKIGLRLLELVDRLGIDMPAGERKRFAELETDLQMEKILRLRVRWLNSDALGDKPKEPDTDEAESFAELIIGHHVTNLRACARVIRLAEADLANELIKPERRTQLLRVMLYAVHKQSVLLQEATGLLKEMLTDRRDAERQRRKEAWLIRKARLKSEPKTAPLPDRPVPKNKAPDSLAVHANGRTVT